jgi:hypothetical protein
MVTRKRRRQHSDDSPFVNAESDADRVRRNAAVAHMPAELATIVAKYALPDWRDVATPTLDFILNCQGFDASTINTIYALLGNVLHAPDIANDRYSCRAPPPLRLFLKGVAGSGKSTIVRALKLMLGIRQNVAVAVVGELGCGGRQRTRQTARKVEQLNEHCAFFCAESRKDFVLDARVTVPVGVIVGNVTPQVPFPHETIMITFDRRVKYVESMHFERLSTSERADTSRKCSLAFMHAMRTRGPRNMWKQLPKYFDDVRICSSRLLRG